MAVAPVEPVLIAHLFPRLHAELMALLRGLAPEDWARPTWAPAWSVRDVAAPLLDGDVRRLSIQRDGLRLAPPPEVGGYRDLVAFLDRLNDEWVRAAQRISPRLLVDLLDVTGPQVAALFAELDPHARAIFPVAWAGDEASPSWFDVGRDYTERWHHQQQIRDAVGAPTLRDRTLLHPVIDISMRALPHTYRDVVAAAGDAVAYRITGAAGGAWSLVRGASRWELLVGEAHRVVARVTMTDDTAWRLFFRAVPRDTLAAGLHVEGRRDLGLVTLDVAAVMV